MSNPYDLITGKWLTPFSWAPATTPPAPTTTPDLQSILQSILGGAGTQGGGGHSGDMNSVGPDIGYDGRVDKLSDLLSAVGTGFGAVLGGPLAGPAAIAALAASGGKSASAAATGWAALKDLLGIGSPQAASVVGDVTNDISPGEFGGKTGEVSSSVGSDAGGSGIGDAGLGADIGGQGDRTAEARGFAGGGYTGNIPRGAVAGPVHGQEFVLSAPATAAIGPDVLAALNRALTSGARSNSAAPFSIPLMNSAAADFTDRFNTHLSPAEEAAFQKWATSQGRDYRNDLFDYDMRGAWKAGAGAADNGHFPDTFKKPNHPTFSDQSQYNGQSGYQGGTWSGGDDAPTTFQPSATNIRNMGVDGLRRYFGAVEPDATLIAPGGAPFGWGPR